VHTVLHTLKLHSVHEKQSQLLFSMTSSNHSKTLQIDR